MAVAFSGYLLLFLRRKPAFCIKIVFRFKVIGLLKLSLAFFVTKFACSTGLQTEYLRQRLTEVRFYLSCMTRICVSVIQF